MKAMTKIKTAYFVKKKKKWQNSRAHIKIFLWDPARSHHVRSRDPPVGFLFGISTTSNDGIYVLLLLTKILICISVCLFAR